MKIGIDASNVRAGGGLTHLASLLRASKPEAHGIEKIVVWGAARTLNRIEDRPWLSKRNEALLEKNAILRAYWQRARLGPLLAEEGCDLLFAPGGTVLTAFRPTVTMSQNLLPFEWNELRRYRISLKSLRLLTLRWSQSQSFRMAEGVIFLTEYAKASVLRATGVLPGRTATIPHGVEEHFRSLPQSAKPESSADRATRLIYISPFEPYKHQSNVARAIVNLRKQGFNVEGTFVGPAGKSFRQFEAFRRQIDPHGAYIKVLGFVPYEKIASVYKSSDIFVFASSCETISIVLMEAMASGQPIVSSDRGPMPEVLGDAGLYFDPEQPTSIAAAIEEMMSSSALRLEKAKAAYERALQFTWRRCADETLSFLVQIAKESQRARV